MRRVLYGVLFLCVLSSVRSSAQWNTPITDANHTKDFWSGAYVNADVASNSVTNLFAANIFLGNYIGNGLKKEVTNNFSEFNRIGATLNYGIYGVWHSDTVKQRVLNFFFAIRHKAYANAVFSEDAFNLAFYGNAMYAGKTAKLTPLNFNFLTYNQAEIGIVCTNFGGKAEFGVGLSFLAGQQLMGISARSATLYTDPTGQYLQFNSNAEMYMSDTSANHALINSYGASMDLYFKAPYKISGHSGTITGSVTDLGFMFWNNKSIYYHKDTSYYYDGVTINSISDLQNVGFNTISKDSLQNKYLPLERKSFFYPVPSTLSINTNTDFGKYHLEIGYNYIFNAADIAYVYVQGDKYLPSGWISALQLGYGGYETINAALVFSKQTPNSTFRLAIDHLQGLILPNIFGGAGVYVEYAHRLGK